MSSPESAMPQALADDTHGPTNFSKRAIRWTPTPFCTNAAYAESYAESHETCGSGDQALLSG